MMMMMMMIRRRRRRRRRGDLRRHLLSEGVLDSPGIGIRYLQYLTKVFIQKLFFLEFSII